MAANMEQIVAQARKLAQMLAHNDRVREYREANKAVAEDEAAKNLLQAYEQQAEKIRRLEAEVKPIEVADKRKLADLQSQLVANPRLQRLLRVEADYVELMRKVNAAISEHLRQSPDSPA